MPQKQAQFQALLSTYSPYCVMNMPVPTPPSLPGVARADGDAALGTRIRALRTARRWTLEQASQACGLARSTLSKIENAQMSPTYDAIIKLAAGFCVPVGQLFAPSREPMGTGRRSLCRRGDGVAHPTPYYQHRFLCTELSSKAMVPFVSTITARRFEEFDDWGRHQGEELVYVLTGSVRCYTEFYEPANLAAGDCLYIDSRMGHCLVSTSDADAQVLWISTGFGRDGQD